ncbi:Esterase FE4 [Zootermopsis nevadensis]|uniref:Esterase FE4 n=2 Tax=Zootermopsis nevadensis TaxID=136037 RepID=A0A067R6Q7_ZOONE|nr:Esterase FE4 [Zootermopsis nevadensis]
MPNISSLETALQDVVVVLHDGGFSHGSGDIAMYGPDYLLDHDVVMVTCNYRLGALGFLATGDESASGNYGLKDQVDVMRWVRRNIHNFSGNPNSVTLFGAGAGAASVHYHMLSVLSHKLFHRAISQSGTALSPWAHVRATTARKRAFKLGKLLGCKKKELEETEQLIKCIGRKPVKDLVEESAKILEYSTRFTHPFVPVEDEVVLKNKKPLLHDRPINIMKKPVPALWEIPWLVGVTSHEGLPQSLQVMLYQDLKEGLDKEPAKNILKYLGFDVQPEKAQEVGQKIWEFYLHNDTISYGTNLVKLAEMTTDFNYYYGLQKSVETHIAASDTPIFVYHFSYSRRDPRFSLGVPHGDDTLYLFPNIIAGTKLVIDKEHFHIIERLLHIITNFVRNGDPTPQETPELNNILWPVIEPNNFKYVDISEKLTIKNNFFPERMAFWDSIFKMVEETPKVVKDEL